MNLSKLITTLIFQCSAKSMSKDLQLIQFGNFSQVRKEQFHFHSQYSSLIFHFPKLENYRGVRNIPWMEFLQIFGKPWGRNFECVPIQNPSWRYLWRGSKSCEESQESFQRETKNRQKGLERRALKWVINDIYFWYYFYVLYKKYHRYEQAN